MSWLPVYNSWMAMLAIVSLFLWNLWGVLFFSLAASLSFIFMSGEVMPYKIRHISGFWLFILSEVAIFASLFVVCLWYEDDFNGGQISDWCELPFLGCFLLIGSSVTATASHHCLGLEASKIFMSVTLFLGFCFVLLQLYEFHDCGCDFLSSSYYDAAFSVVGLHFSHVVLGLLGLSILLYLGVNRVGVHYMNMGVWYWHFVDYIWLLVFTIVYLS